MAALLSGEMKDSAQLNALAAYGLERFFSKAERVEILRAMPGISSMLPKGGDRLWGEPVGVSADRTGNNTFAPDDEIMSDNTFGTFLKVHDQRGMENNL